MKKKRKKKKILLEMNIIVMVRRLCHKFHGMYHTVTSAVYHQHCKAPPQAPLNFSLNCVNAANDGFILLKIYIENNYNYTIQIIHLKKNVEIIHGISLHIF